MRKGLTVLIVIVSIFVFFMPGVKASGLDEQMSPFAAAAVGFGHNIYIQPDQVKDGNVVNVGGSIYVNGKVKGDVVTLGGKIYLNGEVGGDVVSIGGKVIKNEDAKVHGKVVEVGKGMLNSSLNKEFPKISKANSWNAVGSILGFLFLSLICSIVYISSPGTAIKRAVNLEQDLGNKFLYGYLSVIIIPVICVLLAITIIGILVIPFLVLAAGIVYIIGFTPVAMYIGKRLGRSFNKDFTQLQSLMLGIAVYEVIKFIPIIGFIVSNFILVPLSLGVLLSSRIGRRKTEEISKEYWDYNRIWYDFKEK